MEYLTPKSLDLAKVLNKKFIKSQRINYNMFLVIGIFFLTGLGSCQEFMPTIRLRPKPKARAGGADDKAAAIFSVVDK